MISTTMTMTANEWRELTEGAAKEAGRTFDRTFVSQIANYFTANHTC